MIYQDITVIIASFHSGGKIFDCINSIDKDVKIIVVENSNDEDLKKKIYSKYKNVECILSKENLGYAKGNNLGLSKVTSQYALILNPDVILENNSLAKLIKASEEIDNLTLAEISSPKSTIAE